MRKEFNEFLLLGVEIFMVYDNIFLLLDSVGNFMLQKDFL